MTATAGIGPNLYLAKGPEDGLRSVSADPGRGRLFIPFAALRGYEEMIAEAGGGSPIKHPAKTD